MPRKLPVPKPETPSRKSGWTVFIYYLDYDDALNEVVRVKSVFTDSILSAKLAAADVKTKGVVLEGIDTFRLVPPHRVHLIVGQPSDG